MIPRASSEERFTSPIETLVHYFVLQLRDALRFSKNLKLNKFIQKTNYEIEINSWTNFSKNIFKILIENKM